MSRKSHHHVIVMPSEVTPNVGFFDTFASSAARLASRAPFFAFCLFLVILWLIQGTILIATGGLHRFLDSQYQLEINTTTTIITFLMVALLQNSQTRTEQAIHHKLNAIADGLADLMEHMADQAPDSTLEQDVNELKAAVGLEEIESTS